MPPEVKKIFNKKVLCGIVSYVAVFLVLILISYSPELTRFFSGVLYLFRPILIGLVIAYLFNPFFRFFERKLFCRLRPPALRRALSLVCTYLLCFAIVACLILLILPQLAQSILSFMNNYSVHVSGMIESINGTIYLANDILEAITGKPNFFSTINDSQFFASLFNILTDLIADVDPTIITNAASVLIAILKDIIFALFISVYLLASKEKRYAQIMKLRRALFDDLTNKRITKLCTTADNLFGKFFEGKLLDSAMIGILLYVCLSIFKIPYAIVIATLTAFTSIIPIVGYLIGFFPSALLVLLTAPDSFITYLIVVFVIYQIDINIISPKILGRNTGVSALCVIVSICIMGSLWGYVGMIIAVPLAATFLDLLDQLIHHRLQRKRLPDDVENYYAPDPIMDPIRQMNTDGKLIARLEKRVLHAKSLIADGYEDRLTSVDRFCMSVYSLARKARVLGETPPEISTQFAAEEAERRIKKETEALKAEYLQHVYLATEHSAPTSDIFADTQEDLKEGGDGE